MSDTLNFARALIGQGVGMGWGDEAEAWLRSRITGRPYEQERSAINRQYGEFTGRYPIMAPAAEFTGGALPAVAAMLATPFTGGAAAPAAAASTAKAAGTLGTIAKRLAGSATARTIAGGGAGAAAGAASDEELAVPNAIMLGGLGAVAGGQAPRIARALQTPYGRGAAIGATQGAVAGAGSAEPETRESGAISGAALGAPLGAAVPAVTRGASSGWNWLAERASPSEETIVRGAAERVNRALGEAGMQPSDIPTRLATDRAMNVPSVVANADPALVDLAETVAQRSGPSGRRVEAALQDQRGGARERVYGQVRSGLNAGNYYADEEALVNTMRRRASTQYDEAYDFGSVDDPRITEALKDPQFRVFYNRAREIADREARAAQLRGEDPSRFRLQELYSKDADGNDVVTQIPDVRTLDYIKRGIDSVIERGFEGQGLSRTEAGSLRDLRREFVNVVDQATEVNGRSAYRAAREAYAGDAEVRDALRSGMENFNRLDHEEITRLFRDMGPAEREAFRTGAARNLYGTIMDPSSNINSAQRVIGSPETRQKLQAIFETPAQYNLFQAALERESQLFHQTNRILGGSATARRTQGRDRFEDDSMVGGAAADLATGGWMSSLANMVSRAVRGANISDDIADRTATMLMSSDPAEVAAAVRVLENASQRAAQAERRLSLGEVGTIGGTVTAINPSPEGEP